jgi:hypothetical protein
LPAAILQASMILSSKLWGALGIRDGSALRTVAWAQRAGHRGAPFVCYVLYRSGRLGLSRRILGYAMVRIARLIWLAGIIENPFSSQVFVFGEKGTVNGFKFKTGRRW